MRSSALASLAVTTLAALSLVACTATDDSAMTDTATETGGAAQPVDINLTAQNNSGLSGQGTLTPQDGSVALTVHVMGAEGEFVGQVVRATCANAAAATTPVGEAGTVTLGAGAMLDHTATIGMPIDSLANGQHAIVFRRGAGGEVVACADVPARGA